MHSLLEASVGTLKETVTITVFVMVIMLIIEFINVQTRGSWAKSLQKSGFLQIIIASLLGIIPGCLGTFTVVSLYTHNLLRFSALVASMISTFGDEAFVVFSVIPDVAVKLTLSTFFIGVFVGLIILFFEKKSKHVKESKNYFPVHQMGNCNCFDPTFIYPQLKNISFPRTILLIGIGLYMFNLILAQHEHGHENIPIEDSWGWVKVSFLLVSLVAFFIVGTVTDHFLEKHLWGHIIKAHLLKTFLWVLGALIFIEVIENYLDISTWIKSNHITILIIAVLVGTIPESGPHIVFITLFANGTIPFGILLANSIVQDGHGALPLLAESKKSFLAAKLINLVVGFAIGLISMSINF